MSEKVSQPPGGISQEVTVETQEWMVTQDVPVVARTPYEAAWEARKSQRDRDSDMDVFSVATMDGPVLVDLGEFPDGKPCRACGECTGGGEGYGGLCGVCADRAESQRRPS